jgi:sugar lactone lactonase YvrE
MVKKVLWGLFAVLAVGLAYLFFGPAIIAPQAWAAPPPSGLTGAAAPNARLRGLEWWAKGLVGPETVAFDAAGNLVTGLRDGRVVRLKPGHDEVEVLTNTNGRPLSLAFHPDGRLIICDAHRGLLALATNGTLEVLATEEGGVPFRFTDDLAITRDGATIYFTDASARHSIEEFPLDILEHQTTGRVLAYDVAAKKVSRLADGFAFTNGITFGPEEDSVVVAETATYRLWRVWVKDVAGHARGQKELFGDVLPGFPDNVRYSPSRHVYWVAIGSPRNPLVDALAGAPFFRSAVARLPKAVQPAPVRHAIALAVDEQGKEVESLQDDSPDSYSPVASVVERDGSLYLGSFAREGLARVRLH